MRKRLWQLHSWLGLIAGAGLLIIGLTGSVLVFREEIENALHPKPAPAAAETTASASSPAAASASAAGHDAPKAPRLGFDALFAKVREQLPGHEIVAWDSIMYHGAPDAAAVTHLDQPKEWRWIEVDSSTGQVLPEKPPTRSQQVFDWMVELHYSFLLGDWGTVFAGLLAVLLCLLGISGVYLYRGFWKSLFRLRWKASSRIFFSDLHKMAGISSVVFNLILGITGAWWNLPAIKNLIHPPPAAAPVAEAGGETDTAAATATGATAKPAVPTLYNTKLSIESLMAEAARQLPGLDPTQVYINFPPRTQDIEMHGSVVPAGRFIDEYNSGVTFHPQTGAVLSATDFRNTSLINQSEATFGALHFGTFGGWPIKLLWCLLSLTPGLLAVSGFLMWVRRKSPPARKPSGAGQITA